MTSRGASPEAQGPVGGLPEVAPFGRRLGGLAIDWIAADGKLDLPIDPADQAAAILHLLDHLRIERAAAFIGASYGAMVGMHYVRDALVQSVRQAC